MFSRLSSARSMLSLAAAISLFVVSMIAIPTAFIASPAQALTVSSGSCTATVDNTTGVSMTVASNGDCVLSFATAATTPTTSAEFATRTWTVPALVTSVQAVVVAGGGGGGSSNGCCFDAGAGGGGGVVVATSYAVTAGQSITVKTGLGGRGTYCGNGYDGGNSQFGTLVAIGGGRGGGCSVSVGSGGSGGGAHCSSSSGSSTQGTSGTASNGSTITAYGRAGGLSTQCSSGGGGGGGGATEVGAAGVGNGNTGPGGGVGGKGGEGIADATRTGSAIVYGSGGGGQGYWKNSAGGTNAGSGSGTNASDGAGIDGVDETGGGGGAGWRGGVVGQAAGDGGSGIVVIRYSIPTCSPVTSTVGADTIVKFSSAGTCTWTVPANVSTAQVLLVAGGGGGGSDNGGGGGGGGYLADSSVSLTPGTLMSVVVGNGGAGAVNASSTASNGENSTFAGLIALGGGGGGSIDRTAGADGGSAGGRAANRSQIAESAIATTSPLQGNNGGGKSSGGFGGGGGGGASTAGANGGSNIGGNGGAGRTSNITGVDVTYAGGGGGGGDSNTAGTGGTGGGGNGSRRGDELPTQGVDGLGGGGGAAGGSVAGGLGKRGGSGIVVIRYTTPAAPTNSVAPVISGTTRTGSTLSTTNGTWTGSPSSYTYQWKRATTSGGTYSNIGSATNSTYVLTDTDIDKYIKVSVVATNGVGSSTAELSAASAVVTDLPDSLVPTTTTPVATATGFTFTISNYSASYTYVLTTSKGSVSRSTDDVTVTGLDTGESATVTIAVTRSNYKPGSKTVTGSATPATTTTVKPASTTTTTAAPALSIVIQAPVTTVAQGQASVATLAPTTTTTTIVVLGANGLPVPTTTTIASAQQKTIVTTTLPPIVTTTTVGPPVVGKVAAGQSAVQVDGVNTDATVTRDNNQMVVTAGSLSATLSSLDESGKIAPLDSDGNVHLSGGDVIKVSVGGFDPGSVVEVWLFSTPTKLGSLVVGDDGTINGLFSVPTGIKSGSHRVVISAKLANGKPTTFTLGILIGKVSKTSTLTRVLIAIPISLAVGFGFILPTQLRRRRKTRLA